MRAAEDDSRVDIEAVTLQYLLDEYNIPVPAKLPFGTQPRIDGQLVPPVLQNDVVVEPEQ
jgi:pilus assembly protein CpaB